MRPVRVTYVVVGLLVAGCGAPQMPTDSGTQNTGQTVLATSTPIASAVPSPTAELAAKGATSVPATPTPTTAPAVVKPETLPPVREWPIVDWQGLTIPIPPRHAWQELPIDAAQPTDAPTIARAMVAIDPAQYPACCENPSGTMFEVIRYSGSLQDWVDRERAADTNAVDQETVQIITVADRPALTYNPTVIGTGMAQTYLVELAPGTMLRIFTDTAYPEYTTLIDALVYAAPTVSDPTPVPATQGTITITAPTNGAAITSPVTISGSTDFWPFEATLVGQIKDAQGNILGVGPVTVESPQIGQGGPFEAQITFDPPATDQIGTLEVFEASAADGSIVVIEQVPVQLIANP